MNKKETQQKKIIDYLNNHDGMTPLDAIRAIGCTKLATRISELKDKGYIFEQEMTEVTTRDGSTRVMKYWLIEEPVEEVA